MPFFTRRRLQSMLNDLRPGEEASKIKSLINSLDSDRVEQAIPAEMELAILWSIKKNADVIIEPNVPNCTRRPDAYSETLFDKPAYIEIATVSDNKLAGEAEMQRAAQIICDYANKKKKGAGKHLYFNFQEMRSWRDGQYNRQRCIKNDFILDKNIEDEISFWLASTTYQNIGLRITNRKIDVEITWKDNNLKMGHNYFSSMPALAYSLEENPIFQALKYKDKQLRNVPNDILKVVFLADGGCRPLRLLKEKDNLHLYKSGEEIITHFINKYNIDIVCVCSPKKPHSTLPSFGFFGINNNPSWQFTQFAKKPNNYDKQFNLLASCLPLPRLEGYQVREKHKQGMFSPDKGDYISTEVKSGKGVKMKFSARALQDLLAKKISPEQFEHFILGSQTHLFKLWLDKGYTITNATFEKTGLDDDDDYIVLEFQEDPAASKLK